MLDRDLAELYDVETGHLNRAVKRNIKRFPEDFMFQLSKNEVGNLKCQNGIARWGGSRTFSFVFTEQGVTALSGVLKSEKAIKINIQIVRTFVSMRNFISQNAEMFMRLDNVDKMLVEHDKNFEKVFNAIEDNILTKKQGIFHKGQVYDAHKFIYDLINSANKSIILIDNYIDCSVLDLFSKRNKDVKVTIYTKIIDGKLKLALEKFNEQYESIEIKKFKDSHDRFLMIDEESYLFGASLKDLGKKWCGFFKCDKKTLKITDMFKK